MAYTNYEILAKMFAQVSSGWLRSWWPSVTIETETDTTTAAKEVRDKISCPYSYILNIYGSAHFTKIIKWLDPTLEEKDPGWFALILEIMDAIHFGAILVDDVADGSMLRKGRTAAHRIYGSSETINRAYLRIFEVVEKCRAAKPSAVPFILDNLTEIHKGQDDSLVWRRDGFNLSVDQEEALALYRECASLKTGALFRLVGQLVTGSHVKDGVMSSFGWYCQLQNDCKNIFSSDVIAAKGALAEDLANGEYSYPILVGLYASPSIRETVENALHRFGGTTPHFHDRVARATVMLQRPEVRGRCLAELAALREENKHLATLWGRREDMVVDCSRLGKSESDGGLRPLTFWRKVLYAA